MLTRFGPILLFTVMIIWPVSADACSIRITEQPSRAQKVRDARSVVQRATAIIDAEVVRPFVRGVQPARVRAHRVLKGPRQEYFEIGERDSCDTALERTGERVRLILIGGPGIYFAPIVFAEERIVDRLLRSDRRRDWPYREGEPPAP